MTHDAQYFLEQHQFAKRYYQQANARALEVERLFKSEFDVPSDVKHPKTTSGPRITRPSRGRAILEKFLTLLSVRAQQKIAVIPRDNTIEELQTTSKIERWCHGYQRAYYFETKKNPWRSFVYWYLLRGRAGMETRFDPAYIGTDCLPLRTVCDDPLCIYSIWGRNGIGWYTKEYTRYTWDLQKEINVRKGTRAKTKWRKVKLPDDPNEMVSVIEYWNDDTCAALVNEELLYESPHKYGFVPLAEAHCMDTPLDDPEWAYQSVLGPIMDSLKGMYILANKLAAGVDLFYWPMILVRSPDGKAVMLNSGAPGVETQIPIDSKVDILNPQPNQAIIAQLMSWYQSDVQLGGIPDIAWGTEPSSLESGFAIAQVLAQVLDKIKDKSTNLEMALGWDWGHKLSLIETYGEATGTYLQVPMEVIDDAKDVRQY